MSVSVQEEPYIIGWARNRNRLKLHSSSVQQSAGSTAHFKWTFPNSYLGPSGNHVVLSIDGFLLVYTIQPSDDEYSATSRSTLTLKIERNYYVKQLFSVNRTANTIELTAISVGHHVAEIYWTDWEGVRTTTLTPDIYEEGSDRTDKPNYAITAKVQAIVNNYNELVTKECDGLIYNPDENGDIFIDLSVLKDFIPQPDLPVNGGSAFQLITNAVMKYRVSYGETWGAPSPRIQNMATTPANNKWYYAICGEEVERYAAVNLPDWKSGQQYDFIDRNDLFWLIGEDTGKTMTVRRSQYECIYGLFYNHLLDMGAAASGLRQVTVTLSGTKRDGTTVAVVNTYSQNNGQVYRIDVSPSLFDVEVTHYTVTVTTSGGSWSRNYIVMPDFYMQNQFLLQNKYGFLVSFVSGELRKESQTEADVLKMDGRRYLDFTEKGEVYTTVLNRISKSEARRLAQCLCNEFHYIKSNGKWVRITIEPGSFLTRDDGQGMVSVEFSFRFVENQQENMSDGDTRRFSDMMIDDWEWQVVARDVTTEPIVNKLLQ